jgi:hypothetical protein
MNKKLINHFTLIFCIFMSGCCNLLPFPNDLIFRVHGESEEYCHLHVLLDGIDVSKPVPVAGTFDKTFYLSFCTNEYTVKAVCSGEIKYEKTLLIPNKSGSLNMGKI